MHVRDWAIAIAIALVYAVLAFCNLGDTRAVQRGYTTQEPGEQITFDFGEETTLVSMHYYAYSTRAELTPMVFEISYDGETWEEFYVRTRHDKAPSYGFSSQFCWQDVNFWKTLGRCVRITVPDAGVTFFEMAFCDVEGNVVQPPLTTSTAGGVAGGAAAGAAGATDAAGVGAAVSGARAGESEWSSSNLSALYDEQWLVPRESSYLNSMYFDEIYHARTAFEMLHGLPWYETTHPPLGKMIIEASIAVFGMTPFAWRFPGTLAGVLMLPVLYAMALVLFRRRGVAAFAAGVFALDSMHFAQTRIATIDSFELLFLLLMFYFLVRYLFAENPLKRVRVGDLLCSGVCMGLACATKWIGFFAAVGAAILLFAYWIRLGVQSAASRGTTDDARQFGPWLGKTVLACAACFLAVPACIYFASFAQLYGSASSAWTTFWWQQTSMLSYHADLRATHGFASPWYEWILDIRPMWWYDNVGTKVASAINTMGNPIVWWAGFVAILGAVAYVVAYAGECAAKRAETRELRVAWVILVAYLCLLVPWMFVSRITFIYHYFACTPFLALALAFWLWRGLEGEGRMCRIARPAGIVFLVAAAAAFVFFLPLVSGMQVSPEYVDAARWLPTWVLWR